MNPSLSFRSGPLTEALGWALVHSLWQGAVLVVGLAVALRAMQRHRAATRYGVALSGLALQLLAFGLTAFICYPARSATPAALAQALLSAPVSASPAPFDLRLFLQTHLPTVVLVWAVGAGLLTLRLLGGWVLVQRWAHRGSRPAPVAWQRHLDRLARQAGIRRAVRLLESARVSVPMTVGWLKPVVLLPVGVLTGLTPGQVEAVLAHELAHIGRHDYLVNLLQSAVETLFFYHPATWWLAARVRQEREHDCDEQAVALTGNRLALAQALTALESFRQAPVPELALAFGGTKTGLLDRVKRVLGVENASPTRLNGYTLGLCLLLVAGLAIGQVVQPDKPKKPRTSSRSETHFRVHADRPPPPPAPEAPPPPDAIGVPTPPPPPPALRRPPADSIRAKRAFRQLDSLTKQMNAYLEARRPEIERLQKKLTETASRASAESLSRLAQPLQQLAEQQARLSQEMAKLETTRQKKQSTQALLTRKQKELAEVERRMDALSERLTTETERLNPVWERSAALSDSLTRLYEPISELSERIGEASARLSELVAEGVEEYVEVQADVEAPPARATRPAKPGKAPKALKPGQSERWTKPPTPVLAPASPTPTAKPAPATAPRPLPTTKPALAPTPSAPASTRPVPVIDPKSGIVGPTAAPTVKPTPQPAKAPR